MCHVNTNSNTFSTNQQCSTNQENVSLAPKKCPYRFCRMEPQAKLCCAKLSLLLYPGAHKNNLRLVRNRCKITETNKKLYCSTFYKFRKCFTIFKLQYQKNIMVTNQSWAIHQTCTVYNNPCGTNSNSNQVKSSKLI